MAFGLTITLPRRSSPSQSSLSCLTRSNTSPALTTTITISSPLLMFTLSSSVPDEDEQKDDFFDQEGHGRLVADVEGETSPPDGQKTPDVAQLLKTPIAGCGEGYLVSRPPPPRSPSSATLIPSSPNLHLHRAAVPGSSCHATSPSSPNTASGGGLFPTSPTLKLFPTSASSSSLSAGTFRSAHPPALKLRPLQRPYLARSPTTPTFTSSSSGSASPSSLEYTIIRSPYVGGGSSPVTPVLPPTRMTTTCENASSARRNDTTASAAKRLGVPAVTVPPKGNSRGALYELSSGLGLGLGFEGPPSSSTYTSNTAAPASASRGSTTPYQCVVSIDKALPPLPLLESTGEYNVESASNFSDDDTQPARDGLGLGMGFGIQPASRWSMDSVLSRATSVSFSGSSRSRESGGSQAKGGRSQDWSEDESDSDGDNEEGGGRRSLLDEEDLTRTDNHGEAVKWCANEDG